MTNEERRHVARRLRDDLEDARSSGHYCSDSETVRYICDILGFRCSRCPHPWTGLEALADLIEPARHECVPGECPINVRHDNDMIDRDALLELADAMEGHASDVSACRNSVDSRDLNDYARRIREACGNGGE